MNSWIQAIEWYLLTMPCLEISKSGAISVGNVLRLTTALKIWPGEWAINRAWIACCTNKIAWSRQVLCCHITMEHNRVQPKLGMAQQALQVPTYLVRKLQNCPDELASKFQCYALFEHGKDKAGTLKNPLLWWKVRLSLSCTLSCYWYCSVGSSTQISHHHPHGSWFPYHPWCCGLHWTSLLKVLVSMHRPALEFEGCDTHSSYVHQGVALGGSYEMGLRLWVDTKFIFTVINILLNFCVYKLFLTIKTIY